MKTLVWLILSGSIASAALAADYTVDRDASVFAIVTSKEGMASRFAHNHFVVATEYTASVAMDESGAIAFDFQALVEHFVVDDPDLQAQWWPRIEAAKILPGGFSTISEKDRASVRESMMAPDQLHGSMYRTVKASVADFDHRKQSYNDREYQDAAQLQITIRGETITIPAFFNVVHDANGITIESVAPMRLTAVGIEPYSAFLGAVRVKDKCHFYAHIRLRPVETEASEEPADPDRE